MKELEKKVDLLAADVICLEQAADASLEDRRGLRRDLDIVTDILSKVIAKLNDEYEAAARARAEEDGV